MASTDNEFINVRERPLSTDINTLGDLIGRQMMDLQLMLSARRRLNVATEVVPTTVTRNIVAGGLDPVGLTPASSIYIGAGTLVQLSATIAPVPGTYDSNYRIGVLRAATSVVIPTPGADTYYLIEGRMVSAVTVTGLRDILDAGTGVFVPTLVDKITEQSVEFQVVAGAAQNAPLPSGGEWVPLYVVFQPSGGGGITSEQIADLRQSAYDIGPGSLATALPSRSDGFFAGSSKITPIDAYTTTIGYSADIVMPLTGTPITGASGGDLNTAIFKEAGLALAANTRYYLYVAPWATTGLCPFNGLFTGAANGAARGVLVLSAGGPVGLGLPLNGSPITLPKPWAGAAVPANEAVLIACLVTNSTNTGFLPCTSHDGRKFIVSRFTFSQATTNIAAATSFTGTYTFTGFIPADAVSARIRVDVAVNAGGSTRYWVVSFGTNTVQFLLPVNGSYEFDYPLGASSMTAAPFVIASDDTTNNTGSAIFSIIGWSV